MRTLAWPFPLPRPYTGIHIANGIQGLLVWGDRHLAITVARGLLASPRGDPFFRTGKL